MAGIEYNALALAEKLNKNRFEIVFLCPVKGKLTEKCRQLNIPYRILRRPKFISTSLQFGEKIVLLNPFALVYDFFVVILLAIKFHYFLKKAGFDIICTKGLLANFYGSLAAVGTKSKCVWDMQDVVDRKRVCGLVVAFINIWAYFFTDYIITGSVALRAQFYKMLWGKISVIYNGVSLEKYNPEKVDPFKIRKEFNIGASQIVIGHIGRFTYWKGQLDFVRAADIIHKKYPEIIFFLVGKPIFDTSHYQALIIKEIKKLNLESATTLLGFREDLPETLAALDIFVHSSIKPEGCPLTIIYAMAMGKAIIATTVSGTNEILTDASGILVPPSSFKKIAEAIETFLNDEEFRKSLGNKAQTRAREMFSLERYASESEKIFLKIIHA